MVKFTGGVLFSLLLAMKDDSPNSGRFQGNSSEYSNSDLLKELVSLIGLDHVKKPSTVVTSRFKTCKANGAGNTINSETAKKAFDSRIQSEYFLLHKHVIELLDEYMSDSPDKRKNIVSLLLRCVEECENIEKSTILYTNESGVPEIKEELLQRNDINFPALILGLWHFTVSSIVDNRDGEELFNKYFEAQTTESGSEYFLRKNYGKYIRPDLTISYEESTAKGCTVVSDDKKGVVQEDKEIKIENKAKEPQTINFNFSVNGDNANVRNIVNNGVYVEGGDYKDDK